jgi:uncharacterized membrane protein YozB (DUF420 family)
MRRHVTPRKADGFFRIAQRSTRVLTGPNVILALKIAVLGVTLLFLTSLLALWRGNYRLHGRINLAFFVLSMATVLGLELLVRLIDPTLFDYLDADPSLRTHLCFSVPATLVMPLMLYTGLTRRRQPHLFLAGVFSVLWLGTFITGVFFLSHNP